MNENTAQILIKSQYTITVNLAGIPANTQAILFNASENKQMAAAIPVDGKFSFTGTTSGPNIFQIRFNNTNQFIPLFIDNEDLFISGNWYNFNNLRIVGSALNGEFKLFNEMFNPYFEANQQIETAIQIEKSSTKRDSLNKVRIFILTSLVQEIDLFIKEKNQSPISSFALYVISRYILPEELTKRINLLSATAKKGIFYTALEQAVANGGQNQAQDNPLLNKPAPDFTQNDIYGKPISLKSFRGKYVLLDFWASWCGPCRQENPNVVRAYQSFKNRNFTVLGISLDNNKANWLQAIQADKLNEWTQVSDLQYWSNVVARLYGVSAIPQNFLVDPSGKIIGANLRGEELINFLDRTLPSPKN